MTTTPMTEEEKDVAQKMASTMLPYAGAFLTLAGALQMASHDGDREGVVFVHETFEGLRREFVVVSDALRNMALLATASKDEDEQEQT
jgi:hypothetical protein